MKESVDKKKTGGQIDEDEKSKWAQDIENRDYYYDDSTGYEVYDPDKDDDDDGAEGEITSCPPRS